MTSNLNRGDLLVLSIIRFFFEPSFMLLFTWKGESDCIQNSIILKEIYNGKQERFSTLRVVRKYKRISSSEDLYKSYFDVVETINGLIVDFVEKTGWEKHPRNQWSFVFKTISTKGNIFTQTLANWHSAKYY